MPTAIELEHFLTRGITNPRLREDRVLSHVHHATSRRKLAQPLQVLAFDHRGHFETLVQAHNANPERIASFKALVADAFVAAADGRPGAGLILDDRYGEATLPRLTAKGYWLARPVESANSLPLEFESGDNLGLAMRTWPADHVAKCLVYFHPADPPALQARQLQRLAALTQACELTGHELLLEVMPPPGTQGDAASAAGAMQLIYDAGIQPDWWKLPPSTQADSWRRVDEAIARNDPLCRGVLVLGMEANEEALRAGFAAAVRSKHVRGFAVGRSIFARAAEEWFAGRWNDERAREDVAARYLQVVRLWEDASNKQTHKEMA
jgi:5-dehydro-2-deoxygluconokinase